MDKKDYKNFCTENHLRYALDECNNPVSPTKRRKYDDHLYWEGRIPLAWQSAEKRKQNTTT